MKFKVIVEPSAAADIVGYGEWITAQGTPGNAERWVEGIELAIDSLSAMPERCSLAPESAAFDREIRQLLFKSHRILFVIGRAAVHVLHVRHAARQSLEPQDGGQGDDEERAR